MVPIPARLIRLKKQDSMRLEKSLSIVGAHAEGEVGRVVTAGVSDVPGTTMMDKMRYLAEVDDSLVRFTLFEPRGCSQMSVNLLLPPINPCADAGFIPLQPDGPHAMSGSNAMCVTTVLLETGIVPMIEPKTKIILDTPSGLVPTLATCKDGKCVSVSVDVVPSFVEHSDYPLKVTGLGTINVDVAFGSCYFVLVDAEELGFSIVPDEARNLVELGNRIRQAACEQIVVCHPELEEMNEIEYVLFCAGSGDKIRNGNVMYPGRMDRSPCGTGTAARLAVLHAKGQISVNEEIESNSIIDSVFNARIIGTTMVGDRNAVLPQISGRAWIYGSYLLGVDPTDPYPLGYTLTDTWGPEPLN